MIQIKAVLYQQLPLKKIKLLSTLIGSKVQKKTKLLSLEVVRTDSRLLPDPAAPQRRSMP
jgi:hypothetical protein